MRIEKLRSIRSRAVFVALFLALGEAQSPTVVVAGVNAWTPIGPEGGNLCALAVAPSEPATVYAAGITFGDGSTLFRSADNGVTWESTGTLVQRSTCSFSVDSGDPRRLYLLDFGKPAAQRRRRRHVGTERRRTPVPLPRVAGRGRSTRPQLSADRQRRRRLPQPRPGTPGSRSGRWPGSRSSTFNP